MKTTGVGIDIIESERFKRFEKNTRHPFIAKNFSEAEIRYCLSFKNPSPHFAGIFAAKEAVRKSLNESKVYLPHIEIRHEAAGRPVAYRKQKKLTSIHISISHTDSVAVAVAMRL